ncbi:MAG: Chorismate synthase [Ignavibacteriae bacterium]|nr:MAG: Chorismate synthase [Ignavibacteriota bacterium]
MTGNSFGENFKITTFGESHGKAIGVVIDGVPPNLNLDEQDIQLELDRRRPAQSLITSQRMEEDRVEILSGVFEGKTLGTPVCMIVFNRDQHPKDYENLKNKFRPGHADFTYFAKYGVYDYRGGGRASGRETLARVAAGAIAKKILSQENIKIIGYTKSIFNIEAKKFDYDEIEKNPLRCPDKIAAKRMLKKILEVQKKKDSVGGVVEVVIKGCPAGIGEPVFNKLDAMLAYAMLSIPSVKAFEIGSGFNCATILGSQQNDEFYYDRKLKRIRTRTNFSGGVLGGISTGENIVFRIAVKPPSSIGQKQRSVDVDGKRREIEIAGRHDPCICPRIVPVAEAMTALVLVNLLKIR